MWLFVIEIGLAVTVVALYVTQVMRPLAKGEPMFPLLWSEEQRLTVKERKLRQQIHEHDLEQVVDDLAEKELTHRVREETKGSRKEAAEKDTGCEQAE